MIDSPYCGRIFPDAEYRARLQKVRQRMAERRLDACLISSPENIYYMIGLNYQGYFVPHFLIVPREGEPHLIARAMEEKTVHAQVTCARFVGYADSDSPVGITCQTLAQMGLKSGRLGIEKNTLFLPPRLAEGVVANCPGAHWSDESGLIDEIRLIKSAFELDYTRKAAAVSDAMMDAGINATAAGVNEKEIAAEVYHAMVSAGGEHPGFVPLIRSTPTIEQEHATWSNRELVHRDVVFLEMGGCVRRYHAPMGRILFVGEAPRGTEEIGQVCLEAFREVVNALRPGVKSREVYRAWQDRVDRAGLSHYQRHHCGYMTGIGFPPSWVGGSMVVGLRRDSEMVLQAGMVFHLMSWLVGTGRGDYFVSDTGVLTESGCEVLTTTPRHMHIV